MKLPSVDRTELTHPPPAARHIVYREPDREWRDASSKSRVQQRAPGSRQRAMTPALNALIPRAATISSGALQRE